MAEKTLIQLYRGGIFDHIGGGFSRYSTDNYYLIPHFEKMLYDNALLMYTYAFFMQCNEKNNGLFAKIIDMTANYLSRELKDSEGGFMSAQDADSEGKEGSYYLFTPDTIKKLLDKDVADKICDY
ncbi:MAG: thioredoxin domain-containing protein [Clostridia bacterium]|nr:thioredoxin domain-containing protein [Clostridia bacterium]